MSIEDVELWRLDDNPYNPRLQCGEEDIKLLALSLQRSGQICPIKVRRINDRYQIVCGHRRVEAARLLKLKTIRAEVGQFSDKEMSELSLVENIHRRDLSDYEKGLALLRMRDLGMTYEEISSFVGYSKQHIANLIKMTELFDGNTPSNNPSLSSEIMKISEHHARLLLRIEDQEVRGRLLRLVISDNLSVRELERMIHKLRSWFGTNDSPNTSQLDSFSTVEVERLQRIDKYEPSDANEIVKLLASEFTLPQKVDFEAFDKMHAFREGFSIYSNFPPFGRLGGPAARRKEIDWFFHVAPHYKAVLRDVDVQLFDGMALATCYVDYHGKSEKHQGAITARGTVIFVSTDQGWKILHEHWSSLEKAPEMGVR